MSIYANKNLKRKFEDYGVNDEVRGTKEAKKGLTISEVDPSSERTLILRRLSPEDWVSSANFEKENSGESNVEECVKGTSVSRGVSWTGIDNISQIHGTSMQMSCSRFPSGESSYDCETQTYYFVPKPFLDVASTSSASAGKIKEEKNTYVEESVLRVCCVRDCESWSAEQDSSVTFYPLPSNSTEKSHWADILKVEFIDVPEHAVQEICSRHFIASESTPRTCKTTFTESKSSSSTKSRMKKKKTCDILIAEEAERVKQSMVTGRPKRTPKPNRNYDWAEIIPLIKNETDDMEELEVPVAKTPVKLPSGQGRRRKQHLEDPTKEKENEEAFIEVHVGLTSVPEINDIGFEDYGADISLPSMPRAPPPKPKGRPPRIQDTCTQTDEGLCSNRGPLREVKVQCNLTAEPLVTCSSCSYIDWKRLDEQLSGVIAVVEGDLCNPVIARCLRKILSLVTLPSHATNVIKLIAGLERDVLESGKGKDIVLVSSQDDWEEVEIENVIHQEEAPICGVREIIPKVWNKGSKVTREMRLTEEESTVDDPDSLGLREATDKDEEEFKPDLAELELEEAEDDMGGLDDDDDWDINNEDQSGAPVQKKKKSRQKTKKEHTPEDGSEQGSSTSSLHQKKEEVVPVSNNEGSETSSVPQSRRRRRTEGDTRWIRQKLRCNECDLEFTTQRKYDLHYSHIHLGVPPWQGSHQCDDCGKTFTQKVSLNVHRMFKHGAPRRFHCGKCTYEGPTKQYLKRHMKVHTGERQYVCQECGKGLKSLESYKNHMVLHTNKGRFFCNLCKKAFNHKGAFTDHIQSHQENRDYACNYCGAPFKAYKHVARHIRGVHLNDKRFICDICGTQHMTGLNLKSHLKKHGDIPFLPYSYQCPGCKAKFRGFQGLSTHLKVVHNAKLSEVGATEVVVDKPMVTPHPTRRPIKYHYSRLSNSILTEESVTDPKSSDKSSENIFVVCDSYVVSTVKNEEIACNSGSVNAESKSEDDPYLSLISNEGGERVIHIFSCTDCSSIFTSESLWQEHMAEVHS